MSSILPFFKDQKDESLNNTNHDFFTQGFRDAGKVGGATSAFNISLENFYSDLISKVERMQYTVEAKNAEIEKQKEVIMEKISIHTEEKKRLQEKELPEAEDQLKEATTALNEFKKDPSKFISLEKDNMFLWIYGLLSLFVAVFLYFFYTSVVYSAVFRDISITKYTLFDSIFYPKAIEEAFRKGISAFMLVIFSPFIFLGLGLVIEYVKNNKTKYYKYTWVGVALFTFFVDAILAYHISERIYNSKAINTYGNVKPFTLIDALQDLNFWVIIALGFCVYLLFGKLFALYNEQRMHKNKFEQMEQYLIDKKLEAESRVNEIKNQITNLESLVYNLNIETTEITKVYDKIGFSNHEIRKIITEYAIGWINYLKNGNYEESEILKIENSLENFCNKKGI
ncbi:hypothetical protein [Rosettibacter firmus]|uniref:hypothetical protein n=1 Tax=Rosettibacter firmus TaxID=3111522 RepID=UPI00336C060E